MIFLTVYTCIMDILHKDRSTLIVLSSLLDMENVQLTEISFFLSSPLNATKVPLPIKMTIRLLLAFVVQC